MIKKVILCACLIILAAPVFAQKQGMARSEVSLGYGIGPVTNWIDTYGDLLTDLFSGSDSDLTTWGAATLGYNFRLTRSFSLGAQVVYSSNKSEMKSSGLQVKNRYWSVMPNVKWSWMNLKIVSLYSRLGAGATFAKSKVGDSADTDTQFAFQVSPIGLEVGGNLAAYAELGIGTSGWLMAGVRYRF